MAVKTCHTKLFSSQLFQGVVGFMIKLLNCGYFYYAEFGVFTS